MPDLLANRDGGADEDEAETEAQEGSVLSRLHKYRERDAGLAKRRKVKALKENGHLECEACGFDFAKTYGERGSGFIEIHHTRPLCELEPNSLTQLSDLATKPNSQTLGPATQCRRAISGIALKAWPPAVIYAREARMSSPGGTTARAAR
jgi:hypothetical protein